jgi:serine/threonine protein kinase
MRRDARPVLEAEALTLTRLTLTAGHEPYIVPFHGEHTDLGGLVMTAIPLALSTYIEDQADIARTRQPATTTMFDPVQGPASYKGLARKLISGLTWLHQVAGMVHGDIKPHNILLRPVDADESTSSAFPFEPLFADFSSAVEIPDDPAVPLDTTRASRSAFTPPFTAPEMLASLTLTSGDVAPTPASDVFSLAATLLAAATGDLLLYPGTSNMQRLAMARQGHQIVDLTRSGSSGHRVPRNGFVERLVKPAVVKDPALRISTVDWVDLVSSSS